MKTNNLEEFLATQERKTGESYKQKRNQTKALVRDAPTELWDRFISDIENDVHGNKYLAYKVMIALTKPVREEFRTNDIEENDWIRHYQNLWYDKSVVEEEMNEVDTNGLDEISFEELTDFLQGTKNRKGTGIDDINTELWKYAGLLLHLRLLHFFNMY